MPRLRPPDGHALIELGKLIRQQRRARGYSLLDFATLIGCGPGTLKCYEQGRRDPGIDQLIRMAHQCDLPLSTFLAPLDGADCLPEFVGKRAKA